MNPDARGATYRETLSCGLYPTDCILWTVTYYRLQDTVLLLTRWTAIAVSWESSLKVSLKIPKKVEESFLVVKILLNSVKLCLLTKQPDRFAVNYFASVDQASLRRDSPVTLVVSNCKSNLVSVYAITAAIMCSDVLSMCCWKGRCINSANNWALCSNLKLPSPETNDSTWTFKKCPRENRLNSMCI